MMSYNLIISGGGTGGHIYPAISIADRLTKKINNCNILFVGAKNKMEMKRFQKMDIKSSGFTYLVCKETLIYI
jgi:UDP-N-acetylglucosamine--N-acetylmuramyl-(pentapeptide) pyrophosphoryl-undecaprenol N-acetylglucosamine transferase